MAHCAQCWDPTYFTLSRLLRSLTNFLRILSVDFCDICPCCNSNLLWDSEILYLLLSLCPIFVKLTHSENPDDAGCHRLSLVAETILRICRIFSARATQRDADLQIEGMNLSASVTNDRPAVSCFWWSMAGCECLLLQCNICCWHAATRRRHNLIEHASIPDLWNPLKNAMYWPCMCLTTTTVFLSEPATTLTC